MDNNCWDTLGVAMYFVIDVVDVRHLKITVFYKTRGRIQAPKGFGGCCAVDCRRRFGGQRQACMWLVE